MQYPINAMDLPIHCPMYTFIFNLKEIQNTTILDAIAVGIIASLSNTVNAMESELFSVFNIDASQNMMAEYLSDMTMCDSTHKQLCTAAFDGYRKVLIEQTYTLDSFSASCSVLTDAFYVTFPGVIMLYVKEGGSCNTSGVLHGIELATYQQQEYEQMFGHNLQWSPAPF